MDEIKVDRPPVFGIETLKLNVVVSKERCVGARERVIVERRAAVAAASGISE